MDDWLTPKQVTAITGIPEKRLAQLRYEKKGFPFYKPTPRVVLYKASEVNAAIAASRNEVRGAA